MYILTVITFGVATYEKSFWYLNYFSDALIMQIKK